MPSSRSPVQRRIGNVFVPVGNMPRAVAWYSLLFGLEPGPTSHEGGIYDVPMDGETGLILDAHAPVTEHSVQPLCFFWTDDMSSTVEHLRAIGAEITSDVTDIGSVAFVTFRDPDGNPLMICRRN